jgi:hypothetical protein
MPKTIYNYHQETGELISMSIADESPLEPGVALVPAHATTIKPPKTGAREVAVFAGGQWQVKADWRGAALFSAATGSAVSISEVGKTPLDVGATEIAPPSALHAWDGEAWQIDPAKVAAHLAIAKATALDRITTTTKQMRWQFAGTSDDGEIGGFAYKAAMAQAIAAGTATVDQIAAIDTEIAQRGIADEDREAFLGKIATNSAAFAKLAAVLDGAKRKASDAVQAATSVDAVQVAVDALQPAILMAAAPVVATATSAKNAIAVAAKARGDAKREKERNGNNGNGNGSSSGESN